MPSAIVRITIERLRRLARLDLGVLDEVRGDGTATVPAVAVVAGSMLLLGLGGWLWWAIAGLGDQGTVFLKSVIFGSLFGVFAWLLWLLVVYALLQRLAKITVPVDQLVRSAGFAALPLALGIFMAVPSISFGVGLVAIAGWVGLTQVAVERTAGISSGAVIVSNIAGFGAWAIVMSLLATGSNQVAPGPFLAESIWDAITGANVFFSP
jgi:hypothetical protein